MANPILDLFLKILDKEMEVQVSIIRNQWRDVSFTRSKRFGRHRFAEHVSHYYSLEIISAFERTEF